MSVYERSAAEDGWFHCGNGMWMHIVPWETLTMERPPYIIGSARDVCLLQGLETGEGL
jgi:hypothetical protein